MATRYFETFNSSERRSNLHEMDGIREAIRLNWLEMEYSAVSLVERNAIRANIERLLLNLQSLRFGAPQGD